MIYGLKVIGANIAVHKSNATESEGYIKGSAEDIGSLVKHVQRYQRIYFDRLAAKKITTSQGEFFIVNENDVLVVEY